MAFGRYRAKRFNVSRDVINLSWLMGVTASFYFSSLGHMFVAIF
ncbi:hypothetical protein ACQTPQ_00355 [Streptococcus hyovaginalis]